MKEIVAFDSLVVKSSHMSFFPPSFYLAFLMHIRLMTFVQNLFPWLLNRKLRLCAATRPVIKGNNVFEEGRVALGTSMLVTVTLVSGTMIHDQTAWRSFSQYWETVVPHVQRAL